MTRVAILLCNCRYLLLNEKGEKMKEQLGVVRTNCIDCLDRTNVTQVGWFLLLKCSVPSRINGKHFLVPL